MKRAKRAPTSLANGRAWSLWPLLPVSSALLAFGVVVSVWPG